jgi:hypothetical protein
VTQLRKKMLEELRRRNYSHRTATTYVRIVRDFAEYFHQPPDKLGPEQIRQYQAHLFQAKKLAPATVSQYVSALRFLSLVGNTSRDVGFFVCHAASLSARPRSSGIVRDLPVLVRKLSRVL